MSTTAQKTKAADLNTDASIQEMVAEAAEFWDVTSEEDFDTEKSVHMLDQQVRKILEAQRQPWHDKLWAKSAKANDQIVYEWIERAIKQAALEVPGDV